MKKKRIVAVSGGFDPLHIGHVRHFEAAKKLGDMLVVIVESDEWLKKKKGRGLMAQVDRMEIIRALACVDMVIPGILSTSETLRMLRPDVFANGGDRKGPNDIDEKEICEELGIEMAFNVGGGKVRSSSDMLEAYAGQKS